MANRGNWSISTDRLLAFRVSVDKKEYGTSEDVRVLLELRNLSDKILTVEPVKKGPFGSNSSLNLDGPRGKIRYRGPYKSMQPPNPVKIRPKEINSVSAIMTTAAFEGLGEPGEYTLSYQYTSGDRRGIGSVWHGSIDAERVRFRKKKG